MAKAIQQAYRDLCNSVKGSPTSAYVGDVGIEARHLDKNQTFEARYLLMFESTTLSERMATVIDDAVDGKEFVMREMIPGQVHSRGTGGKSKFDCGKVDPQEVRMKLQRKRQQTELLYVDREYCNRHLIGSVFQDGQDGAPNILGNTRNLFDIDRNTNLSTEMMVYDFHAMACAIDDTYFWGNFVNTKGDINALGVQAPHYDGLFKKALLQASTTRYNVVQATLPAIAGNAKYFLKYKGTTKAAVTSIGDLITAINALKTDIKGELNYTAQLIDTDKVRIIANKVTDTAYGIDAITLHYSETGLDSNCGAAISVTVLETAMPYHETPLLFDYSENITDSNFYEYFRVKLKAMMEYKMDSQKGQRREMVGRNVIAIDPLLLVDKAHAVINEIRSTFNAANYLSSLDSMFPDFVPCESLKGTGTWLSVNEAAVVYLTNTTQSNLGVNRAYYSEERGTVISQIETLANVEVLDFLEISGNILNHPFAGNLTPAYLPENLPHYATDIRKDAIRYDGYNNSDDSFTATAQVTNTDTGTDTNDLRLLDTSSIPTGETATYEWTIHLSGASPVQPGSQVADVTVVLTDAQLAAITHVELAITLSSGEPDTTFILAKDIVTL